MVAMDRDHKRGEACKNALDNRDIV